MIKLYDTQYGNGILNVLNDIFIKYNINISHIKNTRKCPNIDDICMYTDSMIYLENSHQCKYKIAFLLEPYSIAPKKYNYVHKNNNKFKYIFTNDYVKCDNIKYFYVPEHGHFIREHERTIYDKSLLVSCCFSNKNFAPGHQLRHELVKLMSSKNVPIDVYGNIVNKYINDKLDSLKNYMFHVVIENDFTIGYYSEKILDCFTTGTIPIYYNPHDTNMLHTLFDTTGIMFFKNFGELFVILSTLNKTEYDKRLEAISTNFRVACKYESSFDFLVSNYGYLFYAV